MPETLPLSPRPQRGVCETKIKPEPAVMPQETPLPVTLPKRDAPIPVPNWPVTEPARKEV